MTFDARFQKISIDTNLKESHWKFRGGGVSVISKSLKECLKLNWNFQGVGDGVWIISGITHTQ